MAAARTVFALLACAFAGAVSAGERCTALSGDTILCGRERVRVEGLHAPHPSAADAGHARQRLQRRLQAGEVVIDRRGRDKHGRTLGRVYVSGDRVTQLDLGAGRSGKKR